MKAVTMEQSEDIQEQMCAIGAKAKAASSVLRNASTDTKNAALLACAKSLRESQNEIIAENAKDMEAGKAKGLDTAMLDRLELNEKRIEAMAAGIEAIAGLEDPVAKVLASWDRPNGLTISRVSVPLGVIGIIYESRPNVTADAGALCLKSGNTAILRGGSESFYSSQAIIACLHQGLQEAGLPEDVIQYVPTTDRAAVGIMLTMNEMIDIIVPRGGKGLCKRVQDESRIPTLQHLDGNCHTYIHQSADIQKAVDVVYNAKLRRTGICGATESLVIDAAIAQTVLPKLLDRLEGCEFRGDDAAQAIDDRVVAASDEDWDTEYLDSIVSVKVVEDSVAAIAFVNTHSSHHSDAIIAEDKEAIDAFAGQIDSAIVMVNTSTQFADGGEFGMGAEIGISTGRLHARGPVGVEQLTTYKYVVRGDGQTRP